MIEHSVMINGIEVAARYSERAVEGIFVPFLRKLTATQQAAGRRILVMLAAPPGAGKSTLLSFLARLAGETEGTGRIHTIGMDGFHRRQEYLLSHDTIRDGKPVRMVEVKGAPETFDLEALTERVRRLSAGENVGWPAYDRLLHNPVEDAVLRRTGYGLPRTAGEPNGETPGIFSYYDMSLNGICTFEYVVKEYSLDLDTLAILSYDHMPAETVSSTLFSSPVYAANVFTVEADSVLQYVAAMTGDLDTTVTASVYLLDGDAALPTEGKLLDSVTETFRYAGYHRLGLDGGLLLPAGARIGIVILETVPVDGGGVKYALVNTGSLNMKGAEDHNAGAGQSDPRVSRYAKGIINPGESFASFESGKWTDWTDALAAFDHTGFNADMAYDNLPVKAYIYPLDEVEEAHHLSERIPTSGGEAAICPEDGYLLLDIAK